MRRVNGNIVTKETEGRLKEMFMNLPNFKHNKTGELLHIPRVITKYEKGERVYYSPDGDRLDVTRLGKMQDLGVRTETKSRI